jgi:hypothetical protein
MAQTHYQSDRPNQSIVKPHLKKYSDFQNTQIRCISFPSPPKHKGRFAIVMNVGRGMWWTRMVRLTRAPDADGEDVWS